MGHKPFRNWAKPLGLSIALLWGGPSVALEGVSFDVRGADTALEKELKAASLVLAAQAEGRTDARDLVATSLAEYERLLNTLYENGHYGSVINVRVNGVEAANISSYAVPDDVRRIAIVVRPGTKFHFGRTEIKPLVPSTRPSPDFAAGNVARADVIRNAAQTGISDWREAGHAKAAVADQDFVANHATKRVNARIWLDPGPLVRFGTLRQMTPSYVRAARIARIAGVPTGETFSPDAVDRVAERLRRTGAFASVALREGEVNADGSMDMLLNVADMKPRRFGFGAEISSLEGLGISGFWLHRNLFGGAERFRFDAEITGVTPTLVNLDATVAARLDIPAAFATDYDAYVMAEANMLREPTFTAYQVGAEVGISRIFSDTLEGEIGLGYTYSRVTDSQGTRSFSMFRVPASLVWDKRDDPLDATKGFFLSGDVTPYYDLGFGPGVWGQFDGRIYRAFGEGDRVVLAARAQVGTVIGQTPANTHPEFLFYSGGGGSVRGQPYQSLSFPAGGGTRIGGQAFAGAQFEARVKATDKIGVVGFFDVGYLGAGGFFDVQNAWHSGAGVGVRYDTGLGPIRLDVGLPVSGGTGSGVQIYVGIGQSF